jgi:hypothetical protein
VVGLRTIYALFGQPDDVVSSNGYLYHPATTSGHLRTGVDKRNLTV